ncbi:TadE family type IV pilus minor pilin [Leifsonia sp. ZF2019]|uniref:TadE family type IV pilus minor pilin n=1 Tax=Leifsonia sp. ZF2019 TaxID=2781978 RepID=UPI001CBDFE5A|nr:TadE family type IV pilus minor pilin [Leifsonia sp. ZF2019]
MVLSRSRRESGSPGEPRGSERERGSVTAEFAVALPVALVCLGLGVGAVQAGGQQLRLADAAAVDARLLGRGDPPVASAVSGLEAERVIDRRSGMVCVTMTAHSAVVGLGAAGLRISARACAVDEARAESGGTG